MVREACDPRSSREADVGEARRAGLALQVLRLAIGQEGALIMVTIAVGTVGTGLT